MLSLKLCLSESLPGGRFEYHSDVCTCRIDAFSEKNNNNSVIANFRNLHISTLHEQGKILRVAALGSRNHSHGYPLAPDPLLRSGTFNTCDWLLPLRHWKISLQGLTGLLKLLELVCLLTVVPEENKPLVTLQLKDCEEVQPSSWRTESRYSKRRVNILKNEKSETSFLYWKCHLFNNFQCFLFIYLFLAVLGLRCCVQAFSSCSEQGLLCSCSAWASHCGGFCCCRAEAL